MNERRLTIKVIIDFIVLMLVGFPILFLYLFAKPYKRGFFCDDETIRHPLKESTVPNYLLYILGLGLPVCAMIVTEFILQKEPSSQQTRTVFGFSISPWIWNAYCAVGVFGFGAASSQLITDIGKYTIGRLRPHFYEACLPDINCNLTENLHKYFVNFECKRSSAKDMRLSFPSGHSSHMMYTMVYLTLYLQARFIWRGSKLLKHLLQFGCLSLGIFTCLTRVSDYKHHPTDVLAGALVGTTTALVVATFISDLFQSKRQYKSTKTYNTDTEMGTSNGNKRTVID
ncbi:putative phosphatidate phosphatase isoform X2 [Chrysoperla carnea]|uniref:putative phosphatidate phosphatase isoform X2 n=1 Tax=Chrysoperla carnea TaxID=189513 RepID=UPI001D05FFE0|nr:putative phosphatidate phosphatase isoform X2 [Chrysoperla carnea]